MGATVSTGFARAVEREIRTFVDDKINETGDWEVVRTVKNNSRYFHVLEDRETGHRIPGVTIVSVDGDELHHQTLTGWESCLDQPQFPPTVFNMCSEPDEDSEERPFFETVRDEVKLTSQRRSILRKAKNRSGRIIVKAESADEQDTAQLEWVLCELPTGRVSYRWIDRDTRLVYPEKELMREYQIEEFEPVL